MNGCLSCHKKDFSLNLQVVIEGVRGVSYRGDIAIDDTNVTVGACSGKCDQTNMVTTIP